MLLLEGSMLREESVGVSGLGPRAALGQHKRGPLPGGWRGISLGPSDRPSSLVLLLFFFLAVLGLCC